MANVLVIHLNGKPVSVKFNEFEDELDEDKLLAVDYTNIYGEAVTIPTLLNSVGNLKAYAEKQFSIAKMELDQAEAELAKTIRKSHAAANQKITEKALDEMVITDPLIKNLKRVMINAKYDLDSIDNLWWSVKSKDMKLNNLIKAVTPQELWNEIIEGTVNNITIKKHKSIY